MLPANVCEKNRAKTTETSVCFGLPCAIRYSDRKGWLRSKSNNWVNKTIVFKTTLNCSHARFKHVIIRILPDLDCTVCYKSTVTLVNLCKEAVKIFCPTS